MAPSGGAKYTRIDVKKFPGAREAAIYSAKYVGKAFAGDVRGKGRKRYLRPRGLNVDVQRGTAWSLDEVLAAVVALGAGYAFESNESDDWQGPPMIWASW